MRSWSALRRLESPVFDWVGPGRGASPGERASREELTPTDPVASEPFAIGRERELTGTSQTRPGCSDGADVLSLSGKLGGWAVDFDVSGWTRWLGWGALGE